MPFQPSLSATFWATMGGGAQVDEISFEEICWRTCVNFRGDVHCSSANRVVSKF